MECVCVCVGEQYEMGNWKELTNKQTTIKIIHNLTIIHH